MRTWRILPTVSGELHAVPVTLPPGCARFSTKPCSTGDSAFSITTGIDRVAAFAAAIGLLNDAMITSTLRRTSSSASAGKRAASPSA